MKSLKNNENAGMIFRPVATRGVPRRRKIGDRLAFAGVYLFTVLLYMLPREVSPGIGAFPIAKIVAIATVAIYIAGRLNQGESLTVWPLEMTMIVSIAVLAVIFIPVAESPQDTVDVLTDTFLKVVIIFALMINLISDRKRLRASLNLVVIGGSALALDAIGRFHAGEVDRYGRIPGAALGGMFGNPNDLATWLNMLIPLAVALALSGRGLARAAYVVCTLLLILGVLFTLSRGGFLGLAAVGAVLIWKLRRRSRLAPAVALVLMALTLPAVLPSGYGDRLLTIFDPQADETGSAQYRQMVLQRGVLVAASHAVVGIGMGNFHIYSIHELKAHNSFVEIAAELGLAGLAAYLALILAPLRSLWRIERETVDVRQAQAEESYYLSIGLQGALAAYCICSFFGSIQYVWFLYYSVAFAISLRRIHHLEETPNGVITESETVGKLWCRVRKGLLWHRDSLGSQAVHLGLRQLSRASERSLYGR